MSNKLWSGYVCAVVTKAKTREQKTLAHFKHNLLTNGGRDWMHAQVYTNTSAGTQGSNFLALTESTITWGGSETALTGEITTNGLSRAAASPAASHTNGTNSSSIEKTWTASGTFTSVLASALFNQAGPPVAGILSHGANFSTGSGALVANDTLKVTWTLNLG